MAENAAVTVQAEHSEEDRFLQEAMNTPTLAVQQVIPAVIRPIPEAVEAILEEIMHLRENPHPEVPAMWAVWLHSPTIKSFMVR